MKFNLIDKENWKRKEYFKHYFDTVPCTYSAVFQIDVTDLKNKGFRVYPSLIYSLTKAVNSHEEFKTCFDKEGRLGFFDVMVPAYTVFSKKTETFSVLWTNADGDYEKFLSDYVKDAENYGGKDVLFPKPDMPENCFNVSAVPWEKFEGFNLNLQKGFDYLLPIFTFGKITETDGKYLMPLAVQVHHAVCDAFHVCRLVKELQEKLNQF